MPLDIFDHVIGTPLANVISILYVFFFLKLSNHVTDLNRLKKNDYSWFDTRRLEINDTEKEDPEVVEEKITKAEYKKHIILLAAGVVGVAAATLIGNQNVKHGISWGAVATILCAIFTQWHNYKESHRLFVLGGSLTGLILFAMNVMKVSPTASIFMNPDDN